MWKGYSFVISNHCTLFSSDAEDELFNRIYVNIFLYGSFEYTYSKLSEMFEDKERERLCLP